MLQGWIIFLISLIYIAILFAIAYYGDKRADEGRSIINNPYVYALSMAVYCTAWTFYGSVGRAAQAGIGFLPIYIGPTLMALLWGFVLRKMIRISKANRITSIADFVASRYGKSTSLSMLVTLIAVVGIIPYIALQLKAVSTSFTLLWNYPALESQIGIGSQFSLQDTPFYITILLALFAILFGTRHLDVTEHHEGLVAAIAFESVIKLLAFLAVGIFVTYGLHNGFGDIFSQANRSPELRKLFVIGGATGSYEGWAWLTFLSMMAILFLPRQFQMSVVENMDEQHLNKAIWLFPLYLLVINIFVLPIAMSGLYHFPIGVDADTFVLTLPMAHQQEVLALVAFIGGFSAATGMVIVASVSLSTMVSNDLLMPLLLRLPFLRLSERENLTRLILDIRRATIVCIVFFGYIYFRQTGDAIPLVSIGLISFAAIAQFAPAILGGLYWKGGTRWGALAGLMGGFLVWGYTLALPSLATSGGISYDFIEYGFWGIQALKPYQLLGLSNADPVSHSLFWSMFVNIGLYSTVSLIGGQRAIDHRQATLFVDVFNYESGNSVLSVRRGTASVDALRALLQRFLGHRRANTALNDYAQKRGLEWTDTSAANADLVEYAERLLSGAIGATSANVAIASVVKEEPVNPDEVMRMLEETSQIINYSRELEQRSQQLQEKSLALETATNELRSANEQLQELDRLKDDFISTVTHELRTPLTSIRAFAEILHNNPEIAEKQRLEFLEIILKESERLTRMINQVLDLAKLESGAAEWHASRVAMDNLIRDAINSLQQLFKGKEIELIVNIPNSVPFIWADRDRITQVMINLLSNAIKFCDPDQGRVTVSLKVRDQWVHVTVEDNGPGISKSAQETIFDKFRQAEGAANDGVKGTGLGLPISQQIVTYSGGELWVESQIGQGAIFSFMLPIHMLPVQRREKG